MKRNLLIIYVLISSLLLISCKSNNSENSAKLNENTTSQPIYKSSSFLSHKPFIKLSHFAAYQGRAVSMHAFAPIQRNINSASIEYQWKVFDAEKQLVYAESGLNTMKWSSDIVGIYTIEATLIYGNESTTTTSTLNILETPNYSFDTGERFQNIVDNFPGEWIGKVDSPWTTPSMVHVDFNKNGSITSKVLSTSYLYSTTYLSETSTFYYLNDDGESLFFDINELLADGTAQGKIYNTQQQLQIVNIRFSSDYNSLFFEIWKNDYGAIKFSLTRYIPATEHPSFSSLNEAFAGKWRGAAITPWVLPYEVSFEFRNDGSYTSSAETHSATSSQHPARWVPALYYGTDDDSPHKLYSIENVNMNGLGEGGITIVFGIGTTNHGQIKNISFSKDEKFLEFDFWHRGEYGPVQYILQRQ